MLSQGGLAVTLGGEQGRGNGFHGRAKETAAQGCGVTCFEVTKAGTQDQECNLVFLDTSCLLFPYTACLQPQIPGSNRLG